MEPGEIERLTCLAVEKLGAKPVDNTPGNYVMFIKGFDVVLSYISTQPLLVITFARKNTFIDESTLKALNDKSLVGTHSAIGNAYVFRSPVWLNAQNIMTKANLERVVNRALAEAQKGVETATDRCTYTVADATI
jgi:hypothetical protein